MTVLRDATRAEIESYLRKVHACDLSARALVGDSSAEPVFCKVAVNSDGVLGLLYPGSVGVVRALWADVQSAKVPVGKDGGVTEMHYIRLNADESTYRKPAIWSCEETVPAGDRARRGDTTLCLEPAIYSCYMCNMRLCLKHTVWQPGEESDYVICKSCLDRCDMDVQLEAYRYNTLMHNYIQDHGYPL